MKKRGILAAALVMVGALSVGVAVASSVDFEPERAPPSALDRRMVAEQLQSFSDYVGFEAHFSVGTPDTVLMMTGGELCADDVLMTLPADAAAIARGVGFERLICTGAHGEHADFLVRR